MSQGAQANTLIIEGRRLVERRQEATLTREQWFDLYDEVAPGLQGTQAQVIGGLALQLRQQEAAEAQQAKSA